MRKWKKPSLLIVMARDIAALLCSKSTYIILGLVACFALVHGAMLFAAWGFGNIAGVQAKGCRAINNMMILVSIFGGFFFFVAGVAGFGEAVRAMDFYDRKIKSREFYKTRRNAFVLLLISVVIGLVISLYVGGWCT